MKPKLLDPWTLGRVSAPDKASTKFFFSKLLSFTFYLFVFRFQLVPPHLTTQVTTAANLVIQLMKLYQKDKESCWKNNAKSTLNGFKGHPNLELNLKTHCASKEKLDFSKQTKITEHSDFQLTLAGKPFKIQFKLRSIRTS